MNNKIDVIINAIEEKKGSEILVLDFEGKNGICDNVVIASGKNEKNNQAIADEVVKKLREQDIERLMIDGYDDGQWILIDFDDVIVHIFNSTTREHYKLEELWCDAKELVRK